MITVERKYCTILIFSALEVGDFFECDRKLYFKTNDDDNVETNAFCFNDSRFTFFHTSEGVYKIENITITY